MSRPVALRDPGGRTHKVKKKEKKKIKQKKKKTK
jgi:hypothetical protein